MRTYNVRWREFSSWSTREGVPSSEPAMVGDIILVDGPTNEQLSLRVFERVLTDPVTLKCMKCVNPFEDVVE